MNRIIKFRGKSIKTGEWAYGDKVTTPHGIYIGKYTDTDKTGVWRGKANIQQVLEGYLGFVEVIPETVGQCTGLCNDGDWYEKDILLHKPPAGCSEHSSPYGDKPKPWKNEKIVILKAYGGFVGVHVSAYLEHGNEAPHFIHNGWKVIEPYRLWNLQGWYRKIGDAHDNPELLKGRKND